MLYTTNVRFIPACAGNTPLQSMPASRFPVHPRVCGEHITIMPDAQTLNGSSPRVRGTPILEGDTLYVMRFIPACAGNTSHPRPLTSSNTVHPRVCGEHRNRQKSNTVAAGSSPRVRGTPMRRRARADLNGFIPACAGNTFSTMRGED